MTSRLQKKKGQKKARSQNFSLTETVIIKYKSRDHPILLQMPEAKHLKKNIGES